MKTGSTNPQFTIRYPAPLLKGEAIGVTAPSSGVAAPAHVARLELLEAQWRDLGYEIIEGRCLRQNTKHVSETASNRAADFVRLWENPKVKVIFPPWGGELLIDMLPQLDWERITRAPKWVVGYSDTSTLLFALTVKTGIASIHGSNFMDTIQGQVEGIHDKALELFAAKEGSKFGQKSFDRFQIEFTPFEKQVDALFNPVEKVQWKSLGGEESLSFSGRLIGGCLDTLIHLVGTPYGDLPTFIQTHNDSGVVLYLENCELSPCQVARALWQMRLAGWLQGLRGVVMGRSSGKDAADADALSYLDALKSVLGDLGIPVLYDADIGHRPPQVFLINGAIAEFSYSAGRAQIIQTLI